MQNFRFIVLAMITLFTFYTCGDQVSSFVDNPGLKVIPADSSIVASLNAHVLLNDPLLKNMIKDERDYKKAQSTFKEIGIDIDQDIHNIYFGSTEALFQENTKATADFVVYMEMSYDADKLTQFIKSKSKGKLSEKKVSGLTVFSSIDPKVNAEFALLNSRAIVITRKNKISNYLSLLNGNGESISENQNISGNFGLVGGNNLLWGLVEYKDSMKNLMKIGNNFPNLEKELNKVKLVAFGLNKTEDLSLNVNQVTTDETSAKKLSTELNNVINFAKIFLAKQVSTETLNSIKIEPKGSTSSLSLNITKQDLEQLSQKAMNR